VILFFALVRVLGLVGLCWELGVVVAFQK